EHWRKGYVSEAVLKVMEYGFDNLGLTRIGAVVFKDNEASSNLLLKVGFQQEGILRDYMYQNGKAYDTYVYSLRSEEHTSELQSRENLVCRLLLEKKNKTE